MANQSLSQILPYKFRNTGSKPGSITNILSVPPLKLESISIPLETTVIATAPSLFEDGMMEYSTGKVGIYACEPIRRLLEGEDENFILWEVGIWAGHTEFRLRDKRTRNLKDRSGITSASIKIDASTGMTIEVTAQAYDKEPERRLIYQYGNDAVWGDFVVLSEATAGSGIQHARIYPHADQQLLEAIASI